MRCIGGRKTLLFSKVAAWIFGALFAAQCGLKIFLTRAFPVSGTLGESETVIGEADGPTAIFVARGFIPGFNLSVGIILSFVLFAASLVGVVLLKKKKER